MALRAAVTDILDRFAQWCEQLQAEALKELSFAELRKCVRTLSEIYVQRRDRLPSGAALDTKGKRLAFTSFYAPIHWLTMWHVWPRLGTPRVEKIIDLGCGTGVGGVTWALSLESQPTILAMDVNAWAAGEATRTLKHWRVRGHASRGDLGRYRLPSGPAGILFAYTLNELTDEVRERWHRRLIVAVEQGSMFVVVEPIAKRPVPWWDAWCESMSKIQSQGICAEAMTWKIDVDLPEPLAKLDRAAGLNHRQLSCRTLVIRSGAQPSIGNSST